MNRPALWKLPFVLISVSSFFLFMAFYTMSTTLPLYVRQSLGGSQGDIGMSMTVFIIAAVILRPFAGRWVDRLGSRPILLSGLGIFAGSSLLYFGIGSFGALLALRFVHGVGFGLAATAAGAAAAQLVPPERKGEGIGYYSLFMSLAMVLGPFTGLTVTSGSNFGALFAMCAGFALAALLAVLRLALPNPAPARPAVHTEAKPRFLQTIFERRALPVALTGLVLAFAYSGITTFISVYAEELELTAEAGLFFVFFALMIVLPRPITGRIFDRHGANVLVYPGIILFAAGTVILGLAGSGPIFLGAGAVIGLGYGLLFPSFQTLALQSSPPERGGIATSTYFVMFDAGYGIGSYALGIVAAGSSYSSMYMVSGTIVACCAGIYYTLHHRRQTARVQAVQPARTQA